jgi:hypothetical protein
MPLRHLWHRRRPQLTEELATLAAGGSGDDRGRPDRSRAAAGLAQDRYARVQNRQVRVCEQAGVAVW